MPISSIDAVRRVLATETDGAEISVAGNYIHVAGQHLCLQCDDDCTVLSILMADKEFGFALHYFEEAALQLRAMQKIWIDEAIYILLTSSPSQPNYASIIFTGGPSHAERR